MTNFKDIESGTQEVYQENAVRYDQERGKSLIEKKYLDLFLKYLPYTKTVLDLGCGSGEPIARYLIDKGCYITGADYSEAMLDICRERFPDHDWVYTDMRDLQLNETYYGIISWGAFFHLNQEQQRKCLPQLCDHLHASGILMISVGHEDGEVSGTVAGKTVYHSSLSKEEYVQILKKNRMEILTFNLQDPDCQGFSVFIARKLC